MSTFYGQVVKKSLKKLYSCITFRKFAADEKKCSIQELPSGSCGWRDVV